MIVDTWSHLSSGVKTLTLIAGAIGAISVCVTGYFAFFGQFAQASDFKTHKEQTAKEIAAARELVTKEIAASRAENKAQFGALQRSMQMIQVQGEISNLEARGAQLQDRVLDMKSKRDLSQGERVNLMRYESDLQQNERRLRDKMRMLDQLSKGLQP